MTNNKVENFFDSYAVDFDSIYGEGKKRSFVTQVIDKLFRQSMYNRYKLSIDFIIKNNNIKSCLDIGTGPGRYCIDISRNDVNTFGVDISSEMIKLANSKVPSDLKNLIKFECIDYMDLKLKKKYDVSVLMGFFDYIQKPEVVFDKLKNDTSGYILASFPKLYEPLAIQRYIRYTMNKCPLYLYSKKRLINILKNCNLNNFEIINNHREYFLIVKLN